jgi:hypothetical protein
LRARLNQLEAIGLIEWVPHLMESDDDDAESIHPMSQKISNRGMEEKLCLYAHNAGHSLLTKKQSLWVGCEQLLLAPVPNHIKRVQMIGVARLRYRPKTRLTAAWWAELQNKYHEHVHRYQEISDTAKRR